MENFKINDELTVACEWKKTRTAFKHVATLRRGWQALNEVKICYLNRTWESYEFESVLDKLAGDKGTKNLLTAEELETFKDKIKNGWREESDEETKKSFGIIGAIASLGGMMSEDKAGANKWKARMLKAGLNLEMPEDWDTLSEDEQEKRLNNVINKLTK